MAVGHKILVIIFHLLKEGTVYDEGRYDRLSPREEEKRKKRALETLRQLGYDVTLDRAA
jgi:hypothetical protein